VTKDRTSSVARADSDGASTMDLSGRCVGNSYVLQHPIGQGATGTVWRGVDRASGAPVAVKLLHESLLRQPKLVTRFVQERTILLMLRHRNVVRVRDLFSVGETLGLVMDLVDGGSLRDHLREHHTVPAGEAARLAAQVAAALAEAHELGVIHRDLKPDNILLRIEDGRLDTRLTDFGIARILNTPSMTTPNAVVGTPHYMAPEAFHGVTASAATDVYALGVVLYELVSGRPPYDSDSIPDLMRRHMEGNPERRPGVPEGIWELITQCMATKPRLRPTAAEMVGELSDAARKFVDVPALPRSANAGASAIDPNKSDLGDMDMDLAWRERGGSAGPGRVAPVPDGTAAGHDAASKSKDTAGRSGPGRGDARRSAARAGGVGRADARRSGAGTGGAGLDAAGGDPEAVSLLPLPRQGVRGNAAPKWRWVRPGATMTTVIAGAMLATAVLATGWHYRSKAATADAPTPAVLAAPTASERQFRETTRDNGPRRAAVGKTVAPLSPRMTPTDVARSVTSPRVPAKSPAPRVTTTRSPQPEAKPYGPWQCKQSFAFDFVSRLPLAPKPCQMLGRDIQYQASLTAPGGGTGSITVALQDAGSGRTVAGPKTCNNLPFGGDAATRGCGPAGASPAKGHKYVVSMSFRYVRYGQTMASTTKGSVFAW
jgi:serine/threonine-protein kinase